MTSTTPSGSAVTLAVDGNVSSPAGTWNKNKCPILLLAVNKRCVRVAFIHNLIPAVGFKLIWRASAGFQSISTGKNVVTARSQKSSTTDRQGPHGEPIRW
jgi:hypothetical protein